MPFSHWVFAIALGLTLCASLGEAQEQAPEPNEQAQAEHDSPKPPPFRLRVEIVENEATAEARQRSEEESRQREIEDLIAQQGMNAATQSIDAATQDMRDYALYSTWLVAVGTLLLIITLLLTYQANRAAVAVVKLDRAWLVWDGQAPHGRFTGKMGDSDAPSDGYVFKFMISNVGRTPALNVKISSASRVLPSASTETPHVVPIWNEADTVAGTLAPERQTEHFVEFSEADMVDLFLGKTHFLVYIAVEYKDVFSNRITHRTEACIRVMRFGSVIDGEGSKRPDLRFHPVGPQNTLT